MPDLSASTTAASANHYCSYFDQNFLAHGLALFESLQRYDPTGILWVLCLDEFTFDFVEELAIPALRPVSLARLEAEDPNLIRVKSERPLVEYYFTLSPCWPRYLLRAHPDIARITYVDADICFFSSPEPIFVEMDAASVLISEHRYPPHLAHHARLGRFNVGLLSFRNDEVAHRCLELWYEQCIEWCHDRAEDDKYADQKYLDQWPSRFGAQVHILKRAGVNLAPWNWTNHQYTIWNGRLYADNQPVEAFHFARFRPTMGSFWFQSGQLEYGVMPWRIRQLVYGSYWRALQRALTRIRTLRPDFSFPCKSARRWHGFWRALLPRAIFGSDWLRVGPWFISGRLGLGRYSGRALAWARLLRSGKPEPDLPTAVPASADNPLSPPVFAGPPQQRE